MCTGCSKSWVFQDRIDRGKVHQCLECGKPWQQSWNGDYAWRNSARKTQKVQPPPGLGKQKKGQKPTYLEVIKKCWEGLPEAAKDVFKSMGVDGEKEPDILEMLKPHLDTLPEEVKKVVAEAAPKPEETTEITFTKQLKQAVGQIRDLSSKKQTLQIKADQAKSIYKTMLEELKQVTEMIEKAQKDMEALSKTYSSILARQTEPETPGTPKGHQNLQ